MEIPRFVFFIGMMLLFGGIMASATNYVIINRFQATNATNGTTQAEVILPGTFGAAVLNGSYTFPADLYVNGVLYVNGTDILQRIIADNNTQSIKIQAIDGSLTTLYNREQANNDTQAGEIAGKASPGNCLAGYVVQNTTTGGVQCVPNGGGNVSSMGDTPYLPYFSSPTVLQDSPVYVASPDKIIINGTANFTGTTTNTTFVGDVQILGKIYGGSPVKIAGGLNVTSGNANFQDIFVDNCYGCAIINGTTINATNVTVQNLFVSGSINVPNQSIPATAIINLPTYNESGIARNMSLLLGVPSTYMTVPLPNKPETTVTVSVTGTSQPTSLMVIFNSDMGNNYMYRRIQAYTFLYQGVTASPRTNLTLEGYQYSGQRQIELKVTQAPTGSLGTFWVSTGDNITVTPYLTQGNFDWRNSTATSLTVQATSGNINSGSYIIVKSEGL